MTYVGDSGRFDGEKLRLVVIQRGKNDRDAEWPDGPVKSVAVNVHGNSVGQILVAKETPVRRFKQKFRAELAMNTFNGTSEP